MFGSDRPARARRTAVSASTWCAETSAGAIRSTVRRTAAAPAGTERSPPGSGTTSTGTPAASRSARNGPSAKASTCAVPARRVQRRRQQHAVPLGAAAGEGGHHDQDGAPSAQQPLDGAGQLAEVLGGQRDREQGDRARPRTGAQGAGDRQRQVGRGAEGDRRPAGRPGGQQRGGEVGQPARAVAHQQRAVAAVRCWPGRSCGTSARWPRGRRAGPSRRRRRWSRRTGRSRRRPGRTRRPRRWAGARGSRRRPSTPRG